MASSTPLQDIDEQFLQCCICMGQLKEPKMLPCLHHYCRDCLKKVFKEVKEIECPTCREKHTLPEGGIDGLNTDFNTKNIIEFIQLQSSVKVDPLRICIHCKKRLEASAFCFKCNNFLCHGCHEFHASSEMVKDHHPHIFSLSEAEARNLTIQRLSSLRQAPKCDTHSDRVSELCCATCGNLPICVPCSFGKHRGHDLEEVTSLAKIERERLIGKVADLMQYKEKIKKMQEEIEMSREKLDMAVDEQRQKLQEQLDTEEENIKRKMRDTDVELEKKQAELEEKLRKETSMRKQELEREMKEAREKYEQVCKEEKEEADTEFQKLQEESDREKEQLQEGLDATNNNIKELLASLKTQEEENTKKIKDLSDHFDDIVERFETVTTTASSILSAQHDWTDVQCIPDICRAIDSLIREARRDTPELRTLSDIKMKNVPSFTMRKRQVDERESVIDIQGWTKGRYITSITSNVNGSLIISGKTSIKYRSHITMINMEGNLMNQTVLKSPTIRSRRYCSFLSEFYIASVCSSKEIGIFDIRNGSYQTTGINEAIKNCSGKLWAYAVTTDTVNNHFMVGSNQRDVYVFNNQLEYIRTLTLPEMVQSARDMVIHKPLHNESILLVCDSTGGRAFAVTMESDSHLKYEFTKPNIDGVDWAPSSVCSHKSGFIYILWYRGDSTNGRIIIAQYSQDGGQIQTIIQVDKAHYAKCMNIVSTKDGEKIVIPTFNTGQLITYGLKLDKPDVCD